jgi:glycosyltransferase involved in cell wall biosynthesis
VTAAATPRASVIVPAHNEAAVIGDCLRSVLASTIADALDVLVVCNGCTDGTEGAARAVSERIRVLESPVAAKHAALNLGDEAALAPVRVYLDADTTVSPGAIEAVVGLLERGPALAASPRIAFDTTRCSWPARQFHRIWQRSPYYTGTTLGAGFYALSAEGRRRFDRFPPVVGDDHFVSGLFAAGERATAEGHSYTPLLPTTLRSMLHVHLRHYGAHAEFDAWWEEHGDGALPGHVATGAGWLAPLARSPANWPGLVLYVGLKLVSVPLGRRTSRQLAAGRWHRDEAGRRATA